MNTKIKLLIVGLIALSGLFVVTTPTSAMTCNSATITGTVITGTPPTHARFAYSTNYNTVANGGGTTTSVQYFYNEGTFPIQQYISGLTESTTYYYRLEVTNNYGTQNLNIENFTTPACPIINTPVNGGWSNWSDWSAKNTQCGYSGTQTRTRSCTNPAPANGGAYCSGSNIETQSYTNLSCFVPAPTVTLSANPLNIPYGGTSILVWNSTNATSCSASWTTSNTTSGTKAVSPTTTTSYSIMCTGAGGNTSAYTSVTVNSQPIPINGGWSNWSDWSAKNTQCGYSGTQTRTRSCTNPAPANGGAYCSGSNIETQSYTNTQCLYPINGGWSNWSDWSTKNTQCGYSGNQTRTRSCTNPAPTNGGAYCSGSNIETQSYTNTRCLYPVNGGWSDWSTQNTQCGYSGTQTRTCTNPTPANGGAYCYGPSTQSYINQACPVSNPYVKLTADNSSVTYNGNTILRWSATNATLCTASGTSNYWYGNVGISGPWNTGALTNSTTYNITCNGASGTTPATDSVTVYVASVPPPPQGPTVTLLAYPPSIQYGASSVLTWASTNATSCSGSGTNSSSTFGSMVVSPLVTTTYSILCTGAGGSAAGTAIVVVGNQSIPINGGWSDWSTQNTQCGYSGTQTRTCTNPTPANGGTYCSGLSTQSYTNASCSVFICQDPSATNYRGVSPCNYYNYQPTSVNLTADRTNINYNENTLVRWYPINATSCYASGGSNGWAGTRSIYSDSFNTGPLSSTTTYNIFCTNSNGVSDTKSVTVFVANQIINNQPTVNLSVDETSIAYNGTTFVRWYTTNATSCYASDGSVGWAGTKSIGPGSFYTGSLTSGKTYSITCTNNYGSATDSATVSVRPQPTTPTVRPTPTSLVLITSSVDRNQPIVPTIDNTRPKPGDEINYTVNYQNVGTGAITNLTLRMDLPYEVDYMFSNPNNPTRSGNTLIFNLGTLRANGQGTVTVRVRVRENISTGTNLNFPAILSYVDPSGFPQSVSANVSAQVWKETITTVPTTVNEPIQLGALAFLFGSDGFLPNSLLGWLLLILLIVLLIMAARKAYYSSGYGSNTTTVTKKTTTTV